MSRAKRASRAENREQKKEKKESVKRISCQLVSPQSSALSPLFLLSVSVVNIFGLHVFRRFLNLPEAELEGIVKIEQVDLLLQPEARIDKLVVRDGLALPIKPAPGFPVFCLHHLDGLHFSLRSTRIVKSRYHWDL